MEQLINVWQHIPENIDPNIISIGQFQVRYYGMMYIVAFAIVYLLSLSPSTGQKKKTLIIQKT
jgi:phosphatidylglycerol:prolipoprotein diacylglycerol transferase